jgi:glutathione S-transferase
VLKIWGRKNSINVQKVLWCCEELGLQYERISQLASTRSSARPLSRRYRS